MRAIIITVIIIIIIISLPSKAGRSYPWPTEVSTGTNEAKTKNNKDWALPCGPVGKINAWDCIPYQVWVCVMAAPHLSSSPIRHQGKAQVGLSACAPVPTWETQTDLRVLVFCFAHIWLF